MTDPAPTSPQGRPESTRQRPRRVPSLPTVLASLACFFVLFEFLALQLSSGRDPAIGASDATPAADRPRPVVIHRRIIVRRVVESTPGASGVAVSGSGSSSTTSASTATAAPAPVAALAPAPVTSSS